MKSNMTRNIYLCGWNEQAAPMELLWRSCVFCYKQVAPNGAFMRFLWFFLQTDRPYGAKSMWLFNPKKEDIRC